MGVDEGNLLVVMGIERYILTLHVAVIVKKLSKIKL